MRDLDAESPRRFASHCVVWFTTFSRHLATREPDVSAWFKSRCAPNFRAPLARGSPMGAALLPAPGGTAALAKTEGRPNRRREPRRGPATGSMLQLLCHLGHLVPC